MFTRAIATVSALGVALFVCAPCEAIPIFAQRYLLTCKTCHTVLPELNAFGNSFRDHGYRLPGNPPVHGTTIVALRYNVVYQSDPPPGTRRYTPNGVILANADIGAITAYLHYNLGAGGGPGQPFLGYLAYYSKASQTLFRLGLFELPLTHSPEQRLDTSVPYGYEALTVGQNNLTIIEPRLGLEAERVTGATRISAEIAPGNFQGAAYGGAPINDGTRSAMGHPEIGLFARGPLLPGLQLSGDFLDGTRSIALPGSSTPFGDAYWRVGAGLKAQLLKGQRLELAVQQWFGRDNNADGSGNAIDSSGGYALAKYYITPHFFAAGRYDTQAAPYASRQLVLYVGSFVTPHVRVTLEHFNNLLGGRPTYGGEATIGVPWPWGY